jgi:hypothetical protein
MLRFFKKKKGVRKIKKINLAEIIIIIGISLVLFSFLAFYLIDLHNIFGWREALFNTQRYYFYFSYHPFFFQHWGRNSGFAEVFQFLFLAGSIIISAYLAGTQRKVSKRQFKFWLLLAISFTLMLLEDAGNLRHTFMSYVQAIFLEPEQSWGGSSFELLYFGLLGGLPLYTLIRYGGFLKRYRKTKIYLIIGYVFYFLAGSLSFAGTAFSKVFDKNFYSQAGYRFYNLSLKIGDKNLTEIWTNWQANSSFPINFYLMDSLVEENLEIIGASALLAAIISFLIYIKRDK